MLLQPCMYVEILDEAGDPVATGQRGEIVLTGGFNFCLPLVRYRTGDYAALDTGGPEPVLVGLEGRAPLRYRTAAGLWLNNIDLTHALQWLVLPSFSVHQCADGSLRVAHGGGSALDDGVAQALGTLFGAGVGITVSASDPAAGKPLQYTSDLPGART